MSVFALLAIPFAVSAGSSGQYATAIKEDEAVTAEHDSAGDADEQAGQEAPDDQA